MCSFNSMADIYSFPQKSHIFTNITMYTFDMLIQITGKYELFPTEFTSFPSTPQWVLSICSVYLLVDMYSFPQNSHIFTPHHNVYFLCAHSTRWQIFTLSHRNHTFSLTSQCILLICSFKLLADMYSFPQKSHFSIHITMCTFDVLIQLDGRYLLFPTEITHFH